MISSNGTTDTDLDLHRRNAERLIQQGKSPAEIAAYLDSVGVQRKKPVTIERSPGQKWEDQAKSLLGSALNSLTFGFADEAVGTLAGLVTQKTTSQAIDDYRAGLAQAQQAEPGYATAGSVLGSVAPALASGGIGAGAGLLGRMAAGAAVGGAMAGAQTMGDATGSLPQRLGQATMPALVGGAIAGAAPIIGSTVKATMRPLASKVNLFGRLPGVGNARDQADALFHRAIERDGIPLDDLIDQARTGWVNQPAKALSVADIGGENLRGLMAAMAAVPGKAKQAIVTGAMKRQSGQAGRLLDDAQQHMKLGLQNVYALRDKLLAQRARDALPLYQAAYAKSVQVDGALQKALDNPEFQRAYTLGKSIAAIEGVDLPPLYTVAQDGSKVWAPQLPVQALDYMKRGLNKRITAGVNSKAGVDRTAAHHLRDRLEGILQIADKQVPEYGMARSFWKGESEAIDALELGRQFGKMRPDAVAQVYGKMSTVEKEMARTGHLEWLEGQMGRNSAYAADHAKGVFGSPDAVGRIKVLFDNSADDMIDAIKTEASMSRTAQKLQGSRTQVLKEETDGLANDALGAVASLRPGHVVLAVAKSLGGRAKTGWTDEVSDELAKRFQVQDPHDLYAMLLGLKGWKKPTGGIGPLPGLVGSAIGRLGN